MKVRTFVVLCGLVFGIAQHAGELTDEQVRQFEHRRALHRWMMRLQPSPQQQPDDVVDACGNGDFETDIATLPRQWEGEYGFVQKTLPPEGNGEPDFADFMKGLKTDGDVDSADSHHTWVGAGPDPKIGAALQQVAPTGSTHAVRIGNAAPGWGSELLSKTFVVPASQPSIGFWYAVVFYDPEFGHAEHERPAFSVRVLDASGNEIAGTTDLVNGKAKVVSSKDPFFEQDKRPIVYRGWTCAQIDLSGHEGETVTVQFVTEDCSQGAHWGYAYVDEFCDSCKNSPTGFIELNQAVSSTCGRGELCFDYTLPQKGATTGQVIIELEISQNGNLVKTFTSGPLTSGTSHCFPIDPATIAGLTPGTFAAKATGRFSITGSDGTTTQLAPISAGPIVYQFTCGDGGGCCPGPNLIANGGFESGNTGFTSDYTYVASPGAILPGQYAILDSAQAASVSSAWNVQNHGSCSTTGKVLVVNGATGRTGSRKVWAQTVAVTPGREYRFCANFRNLPQCNLDVKPDVEIRFSVPPAATTSVVSTNAANGCDWARETRSVLIPAGVTSLTTEIWLDEAGAGDGNDLAIDDLSLHEMQKASPSAVLVNIASSNLTTATYNITATPAPQTLSHYWEVCEVDSAGNCIASTQVQNPPAWFPQGPNDFKGYAGSSVLGTLTSPGIFQVGKKYKIVYGVFDLCTSFTSSTWYFSFNINTGRVEVERALR